MSVLTANGLAVAIADVCLPRFGRGWASVMLDQKSGIEAGEAVNLKFETGETMSMTCDRTWRRAGFLEVWLVLGKNCIQKTIRQRFYEGIPAATVVSDLLRDVGEAQGNIQAATLLNQWVRHAGTASQQLTDLCLALGVGWRIGRDGTVSVQKDTTPSKSLTLETWYWSQREVVVALNPSLAPYSHQLTLKHDDLQFQVVPQSIRHQINHQRQMTEVQW
jgi:hypothetical protein